MAGYSVDNNFLRRGATAYSCVGEYLVKDVERLMPVVALPDDAFPRIGFDVLKGQYAEMWSAIDFVGRSLGGVVQTLGYALDKVADNYENVDGQNEKIFQTKAAQGIQSAGLQNPPPVVKRTMPNAQESDQALIATMGGLSSIALAAVGPIIAWLKGVSTAFIGVVLAVDAAVMSNLADPSAHIFASVAWQELQVTTNLADGQIRSRPSEISSTANWTGSGAKSFTDFASNHLASPSIKLNVSAGAMRDLTSSNATALLTSLGAYIAATITVATACSAATAADAAFGVGEAFKATAISAWATFAVGIVANLGTSLWAAFASTQSVTASLGDLANSLSAGKTELDYKPIAMTPEDLKSIGNVDNWKPPANPPSGKVPDFTPRPNS